MAALLNQQPKIETLPAICPDPAIRYYVHSKILQMDGIYLYSRVRANTYHVLAFLLLPELITTCQSLPGTMVSDMIDFLLKSSRPVVLQVPQALKMGRTYMPRYEAINKQPYCESRSQITLADFVKEVKTTKAANTKK